jgi:hypothetical protein
VYEDFEKRFRIPTNFIGEPPHFEAQPPLAVAKINLNFHFIFPFHLLFISIFNYLFLFLLLFLFNFNFDLFCFYVVSLFDFLATIMGYSSRTHHHYSMQPVTTLFPPYFIPQPSPNQIQTKA